MNIRLILCLDIGGTHISAAIIDSNKMLPYNDAYVRGDVDSNATREKIVADWDAAISSVLDRIEGTVDACMVSVPGPFDYANGISLMDGMHKYQDILGMDMKGFLGDTYGIDKARIFFYNDAQAFLLGEIYNYHLEGQRVVGLTLGTGLGSALYEGSDVKDLNFGSASFREGIAEDYISTRGIVKYLKDQGIGHYHNVKQIIGDETNLAARELAMHFLTEALVSFIGQYIIPLNPGCIVVGGSIAKSHHLFLKHVAQQVPIPVKPASFDELNLFYGMISTTKKI